jgi:hypothetical protein
MASIIAPQPPIDYTLLENQMISWGGRKGIHDLYLQGPQEGGPGGLAVDGANVLFVQRDAAGAWYVGMHTRQTLVQVMCANDGYPTASMHPPRA